MYPNLKVGQKIKKNGLRNCQPVHGLRAFFGLKVKAWTGWSDGLKSGRAEARRPDRTQRHDEHSYYGTASYELAWLQGSIIFPVAYLPLAPVSHNREEEENREPPLPILKILFWYTRFIQLFSFSFYFVCHSCYLCWTKIYDVKRYVNLIIHEIDIFCSGYFLIHWLRNLSRAYIIPEWKNKIENHLFSSIHFSKEITCNVWNKMLV